MHKVVKIAEKRDANTEMRFVTRGRIVAEILETEQAVAKQIVNFVRRDAMRGKNIEVKPVAALIAVEIIVFSIVVIISVVHDVLIRR
jgi:hypothetical protein